MTGIGSLFLVAASIHCKSSYGLGQTKLHSAGRAQDRPLTVEAAKIEHQVPSCAFLFPAYNQNSLKPRKKLPLETSDAEKA